MRYPLNPLKNVPKNKPYLTWDCETVNWVKFLVVGVYDGIEFRYFSSLVSFLKYLCISKPGYLCFSHFGGRFDHLFAIKAILQHNARCKSDDQITIGPLIPRGSSILSFDITYHQNKVTFVDSSAVLPFGLRKLTQSFNVKHIKQEIDYTKIRKITPKLLRYLKYDCVGLYECLQKFWEWDINKNVGRSRTIASQSIRVLRSYIKTPIGFIGTEIDSKIRSAYFGGRTEIFKPYFKSDAKSIYGYDVNSLYPYVMSKHDYPNFYRGETNEYVENEFGIYYVVAHVPDMHIPPIPKIYRGKLIFPVGDFSACLTSSEIEYCKTLGITFDIRHGYLFSNGGKIFKSFVKTLYRIRENSSSGSVDNIATKLLLNSCYGKFGQRTDREQLVFDDGSPGLRDSGLEIRIGKKLYRLMHKPVDIPCFTNVAIAAFVTAYARIHMHKLLAKCGEDLYYTDTDSIYTTRKMPTSMKLGKLKLEQTESEACFLLPKTYVAGKKIAMKGFEKKKIQEFTLDDFTDALRGDMEALKINTEPKFATLKTAIKLGDITSLTKSSTRQIRAKYDKRKIIRNSNDLNQWSTKPIKLRMKDNGKT